MEIKSDSIVTTCGKTFTKVHIERVMQLPVGFLSNQDTLKLPETKALLSIINTYPWMLRVAEEGFIPKKNNEILIEEGLKKSLQDSAEIYWDKYWVEAMSAPNIDKSKAEALKELATEAFVVGGLTVLNILGQAKEQANNAGSKNENNR